MQKLQVARRALTENFIRAAREGDGWPGECDVDLNDACRALVQAFADEHGEAWLGKINLYGDERHGGAPVLWKWDDDVVLNFSCAFVCPKHDAELERLIRERDDATYTGTKEDAERVDRIMDRLAAVGGVHLFWT